MLEPNVMNDWWNQWDDQRNDYYHFRIMITFVNKTAGCIEHDSGTKRVSFTRLFVRFDKDNLYCLWVTLWSGLYACFYMGIVLIS